jgi:hypothetical protein
MAFCPAPSLSDTTVYFCFSGILSDQNEIQAVTITDCRVTRIDWNYMSDLFRRRTQTAATKLSPFQYPPLIIPCVSARSMQCFCRLPADASAHTRL